MTAQAVNEPVKKNPGANAPKPHKRDVFARIRLYMEMTEDEARARIASMMAKQNREFTGGQDDNLYSRSMQDAKR